MKPKMKEIKSNQTNPNCKTSVKILKDSTEYEIRNSQNKTMKNVPMIFK